MTDRFAALVDQRAAETVHVLGPTITFLAGPDGHRDWIRVRPGDIYHVPGDVPPDQVAAFVVASERHGYWNATPEENAAIGIAVPASGLTPVGD